MDFVKGLFSSKRAMRNWLVVSLICNMVIIITGAVVRLTGSGLGCPTWPKCSSESYIPHSALSYHSLIEFGNRTLTFVLIAAAAASLVAVYRVSTDRALRIVCWVILGGIAVQAIIGGITVWLGLNPFLVGIHLLVSVGLLVACTWTVLRANEYRPMMVDQLTRWLSIGTFAMAMLVIYLGTLVTGSGPHSGDDAASRTGFDIATVSRLHSLAVWALLALTIVAIVVVRRRGFTQTLQALYWFVGALAFQGLIGYIQYFSGLPVFVVILHMIGTTIVTVLASVVLFSNRLAAPTTA